MENQNTSQTGFAQRWLPWLIAAAALLFYSVTLVRWGTFASLPFVSKALGWDWRPSFHDPLYFLMTYPIRWLPSAWQLVALNGFMVVAGATVLGLLARSVALLPHDRTKEQRQLERSDYSFLTIRMAWIPPLLAALACGLQLTFWEHTVEATGEILDLLLFAFVVWSLLEYRIDEKEWRLVLAAFVQGLAMTNNFAAIAFLPAFVLAVIWIKGLTFFKARFVLIMTGAGLAGLCLYFLLPLYHSGSGLTHLSVWEMLLVNWGFQKNALLGFPRYLLLMIGLTSLVPVLFIGIRWPAQVGDISAVGATLTRLMILVVHAVFLAACLYTAFDPPFSPRRLGGGYSFLPLYFLSALSAGYFAGYFLLVCGARPVKSWERPSPIMQWLNWGMQAAICVVLVILPVQLFLRNYPQLILRQDRALHLYADAARQALPDTPAVVLSDDGIRLMALQAVLSQSVPDHDFLLVNSSAIMAPAFHRRQHQRTPTLWPDTLATRPLTAAITDAEALQFVVQLSSNTPIYYLHHSFGYYFERFYSRQKGLAAELRLLPEKAIRAPALSEGELEANDQFFNRLYQQPTLQNLIPEKDPATPDADSPPWMPYYRQIFSAAFNNFGTLLQQASQLKEAGTYFERALALNPDNPSAYINWEYNRYLQNPEGDPPKPDEETRKRLEPYAGNWNHILGANGPVDEPNSRFLLAQAFVQGNNFRQAAQELLRAAELDPSSYIPRLSLAGVLIKLNRPDEALQTVRQLQESLSLTNMPNDAAMKLLEAEAWAHVLKGDLPKAEQVLRQAQANAPQASEPFFIQANIYLSMGRQTNAVAVYKEQLRHQPDNVNVLINLSALYIVLADYTNAVVLLDKAVGLDPKSLGALMNRAIAHLRAGHLEEAKRDYQNLQVISPKPIAAAFYGLGEIAWLQQDFPVALRYYEQFLKVARSGGRDIPRVQQRIEAIRSGAL